MSEVRLPPIKRIEGHGRVSLFLDADGRVAQARFDAVEFRGFEAFLPGRMVWEMPLITSRVCGICPVSHHLAAVRAVDAMLGADVPRAGRLLRELLQLAGFVHDHALHFFFLAGPDFLLDGAPVSRDILGVVAARPDLAKRAIALRRAGQTVVEAVGGQGHPVTAIPGGMSRGIRRETREELAALTRGALEDALEAERLARDATLRLLEEHPGYADAPTHYLAQMGEDGGFSVYDGSVEVLGTGGDRMRFAAADFEQHIAEGALPDSFAKVPYLAALGPKAGTYRVGPLARLNLTRRWPGPRSAALAEEAASALGRPAHATLAYHWARMIELVAVLERMLAVLSDDEVVSDVVRVKLERGGGIGAAAVEAPRGTLFHLYEADDIGRVTRARLIVATTNNSAAIDRAVGEALAGERYDGALGEEAFLRMELGIRAYDPCLSCATHEVGKMPLAVDVFDAAGTLLASEGVA